MTCKDCNGSGDGILYGSCGRCGGTGMALVPCWWCGNPDTRVEHGAQPARGDPPGACVRCHGPPDECCGTASPFVWCGGMSIKWARREALEKHNAGPRKRVTP